MSPPVELIVGLGNPGPDYAETRHNAGFWWVDRVAAGAGTTFRGEARFFGELADARVGGERVRLLKPMTYMNHSGRSVAAVAAYFKIAPEAILIAHDEIDLPAGVVRLKRGGGDGGHRGLRDIIPAIGSRDFARLRIGVGRPKHREDVIDYVLKRASKADQQLLDEAVESSLAHLDKLISGDHQKVMNTLHRNDPAPEPHHATTDAG